MSKEKHFVAIAIPITIPILIKSIQELSIPHFKHVMPISIVLLLRFAFEIHLLGGFCLRDVDQRIVAQSLIGEHESRVFCTPPPLARVLGPPPACHTCAQSPTARPGKQGGTAMGRRLGLLVSKYGLLTSFTPLFSSMTYLAYSFLCRCHLTYSYTPPRPFLRRRNLHTTILSKTELFPVTSMLSGLYWRHTTCIIPSLIADQ
jgi:hypothetical protein